MDLRHQFSDFGLWISDMLQTSDFSLQCQTSYRCQTSNSKTQTIYLSHNKNKVTYVTKKAKKKYIIIYVMRIRRLALISMVIAIMQTTSDRLRTVFKLRTDLGQTSDKLQTDFRCQTPTSEFGPRRGFEHQTSDFRLLTLNFTLQI